MAYLTPVIRSQYVAVRAQLEGMGEDLAPKAAIWREKSYSLEEDALAADAAPRAPEETKEEEVLEVPSIQAVRVGLLVALAASIYKTFKNTLL